MAARAIASGLASVLAMMLCACVESGTISPVSDANFKPRDRQFLAAAPYARVSIPESYQRHLVEYHRKEAPGTIIIDSNNKYLY
jgi:hypothetical protein